MPCEAAVSAAVGWEVAVAGTDLWTVREHGGISKRFMGGFIGCACAGPLRRTFPAIFRKVKELGGSRAGESGEAGAVGRPSEIECVVVERCGPSERQQCGGRADFDFVLLQFFMVY